jgi:hypothetical protein
MPMIYLNVKSGWEIAEISTVSELIVVLLNMHFNLISMLADR